MVGLYWIETDWLVRLLAWMHATLNRDPNEKRNVINKKKIIIKKYKIGSSQEHGELKVIECKENIVTECEEVHRKIPLIYNIYSMTMSLKIFRNRKYFIDFSNRCSQLVSFP